MAVGSRLRSAERADRVSRAIAGSNFAMKAATCLAGEAGVLALDGFRFMIRIWQSGTVSVLAGMVMTQIQLNRCVFYNFAGAFATVLARQASTNCAPG